MIQSEKKTNPKQSRVPERGAAWRVGHVTTPSAQTPQSTLASQHGGAARRPSTSDALIGCRWRHCHRSANDDEPSRGPSTSRVHSVIAGRDEADEQALGNLRHSPVRGEGATSRCETDSFSILAQCPFPVQAPSHFRRVILSSSTSTLHLSTGRSAILENALFHFGASHGVSIAFSFLLLVERHHLATSHRLVFMSSD